MTVVPGMSVVVPRQSWYGLRNTGTGLLQAAWVATASVVGFFRELSQSGAADLEALRRRYGVELRPESGAGSHEAAVTAIPRRRRHRGGRGRGRRPDHAAAGAPAERVAAPSASAPTSSQSPATAAQAAAVPGRRRHRRGRRGGARPSAVATGAPPPLKSPAPSGEPSRSPRKAGTRPEQRRLRHERFKEVYMGGRWVRVSGEGPVIASGEESRESPRKSRQGNDDTPAGPLSVPL